MNPKRKGNAGEHELLSILQPWGAVRNDQRYIGGVENPDIALPGYHIEVKRCERLNIHEAMRQATHDANGKAVPVVVHRRNRERWLVTLWLSDALPKLF